MPNPDRLAALLAEYRSLNRERDAPRMRQVLAEAAPLVDRQVSPKMWASMRSLYAQLSASVDPEAAIAAYEDALTVWSPDADRESWIECHSDAGMLFFARQLVDPGAAEKALGHLERAVADQPYLATPLAFLYQQRTQDDLAENWQRRVRYLDLALSQISREREPARWAKARNDLAVACSEEPGADFARAMEKRLDGHLEAWGALDEAQGPEWIETCLHLSECYLFRARGDPRQNLRRAEEYARAALAACAGHQDIDRRHRALLGLTRVLAAPDTGESAPRLREALALLDTAQQLIAGSASPAILANVEALRVNVHLKLLRLGEGQSLAPLAAAAAAALQGLDPRLHAAERRRVLQAQGRGLLEGGDLSEAIPCLDEAVALGEAALARETSLAARLERIFQLADSAVLASYAHLRVGEVDQALDFLDRGKARLWDAGGRPRATAALPDLVPEGGALLFPVFALDDGAVVIVVRSGKTVRSEVAWLPHFGKPQILELQRGSRSGDGPDELGGWLGAYYHRSSQPESWRRQIESAGEVLYREVWAPVLAKLSELGIAPGAELVWFPQGGSGVFPMHAAWHAEAGERRWIVEEYALRYAPSVQALGAAARTSSRSGPALLVVNPAGDLDYSELEGAWVERHLMGRPVEVLRGEAATKAAVLAALARCEHAHLSTHAVFALDDPFQSCLALAGGQTLTLAELLPLLAERPPALVVLSACETAMARVTSTPDELLGFPAALLGHGARAVLATMWPVDDAAAAFLVGRFYREHGGGEATTAAEALRRAQDWLRTVTVREVLELLRDLGDEPAPAGPLAAELHAEWCGDPADLRPFAEPYYWAAFALTGG
jgi:CHAT domain-containing protein